MRVLFTDASDSTLKLVDVATICYEKSTGRMYLEYYEDPGFSEYCEISEQQYNELLEDAFNYGKLDIRDLRFISEYNNDDDDGEYGISD